MSTYDILIVEDEENVRESWARDVRDFNREGRFGMSFRPIFATTKIEAMRVLMRTRIDCAVVDLRLPDGDANVTVSSPLGNDVLRLLLDEVGVPAVVYSGYEAEASDDVRASNIRVMGKEGGAQQKILESFAAEAGLMLAMESTRSRIASETARLFHQSIWPRWQRRWSTESDREMISGIIARQTASHIAENLSLAPAAHHPDEFYVVPAIHSARLDTGDLIKVGDQYQIVLTPRCNMANRQPSYLLLAICTEVPLWEDWRTQLAGSNKQKEKASKELRNHATQGHEIATHFLPPLDELGPWLVDFKEVRTISREVAEKLLPDRVASVAPQFVPNLVQRYSTYLGRIGQPDLSVDILLGVLGLQS